MTQKNEKQIAVGKIYNRLLLLRVVTKFQLYKPQNLPSAIKWSTIKQNTASIVLITMQKQNIQSISYILLMQTKSKTETHKYRIFSLVSMNAELVSVIDLI